MAEKFVDDLYEPLKVSQKLGREIAEYFATAVKNAKSGRGLLEQRWERAHKLFEGIRPEKSWPWKDCANTHIPLVSTHASAIHARFMTSIFGQEPMWTVKPRQKKYLEFCNAATDGLDWSAKNEMGLYEAVRDAAWDAVKLNLGVLKCSWKREVGTYKRFVTDKKGKKRIKEVEGVLVNKPVVESIQPNLFVWEDGARDIQTAEWVCHILRLSPSQIRHMYRTSRLLTDKDALLQTANYVIEDAIDRQLQQNEGIFRSKQEYVEVYEVWGRYEVDGKLEELKLIVEPGTYSMPLLLHNPLFNKRRPFEILRLETREHSITGIGVADMIGDINEEMNVIHNQTIDATTVSICGMFGVRAGTPAWEALEKIHPGKRVPMVSDTDIKEIGLGPLKVNSLPLEEFLRSYAERRTGISDFGLGREPSPAHRGTATGTLAMIQEGNRKFDYQVADMRRAISNIGMCILSMEAQMFPDGRIIDVLGPDGQSWSQIQLLFPEDGPLEQAVVVEVNANTAAINRQAKRQDTIALFQLIMSFYAQAIELGEKISMPGHTPPFVEMTTQMARGGEILMRELLSAFENRQADEILPDLQELYAQIGALGLATGFAQTAGMGGPPGGAGEGGPGAAPGGPQSPPQRPGGGGPSQGSSFEGGMGGPGGG